MKYGIAVRSLIKYGFPKSCRSELQGSRLSMVFVLPTERDGLAKVEAKLATTDLNELDKKLRKAEVEVTIPKFKLEEACNLVDDLSKVG